MKPLKGHRYHELSNDALRFIVRDAADAARAMQGLNDAAESKYLDQLNDAQTILFWRYAHGGR